MRKRYSFEMKLRTVGKLGVILSVILFCIGMGFTKYAHAGMAELDKDFNLLTLVTSDCIGVLETDNLDLLVSELPHTTYASEFDSLHNAGIVSMLFKDTGLFSDSDAHGIGNQLGKFLISFHRPSTPRDIIVYFTTDKPGEKLFEWLLKKGGGDFNPKRETYQGKDIVVYPMKSGYFLSTYSGKGFVAVSYQKKLIEQVIDTEKKKNSLAADPIFSGLYHSKSANFMTLYARNSSFPLLSEGQSHVWSEFDIHINSEVCYLGGSMHTPDSCVQRVEGLISTINPVELPDSVIIESNKNRVDSCVSKMVASSRNTLFDECVSNLSREASYIMVADMDYIASHSEEYKSFLPTFIYDNINMFRSFIFSVQITEVNGRFSHIFVFTYKN